MERSKRSNTYISGHFCILHQHVRARNAHKGKLNPSIVNGISTLTDILYRLRSSHHYKLGPTITNIDARKEGKGFRLSQGHDKWLHTKSLSIDNQIGKDNTMCGRFSCTANPPFGRGEGGAVNDKFIVNLVKGGSSFDPGYIRTVSIIKMKRLSFISLCFLPKFCHGKATNQAFQVHHSLSDPVGNLFWSPLTGDSFGKERILLRKWRSLNNEFKCT